MRYAAVACVVAGGLLMSGTGAVALAEPTDSGGSSDTGTGDGGGTEAQATGTAATTVPTATLSGTSSVFATATAGPVPGPPVQAQSLPKSDPTDGLGLKSTLRLDPQSLSNLLSPQLPPLTSTPAQAKSSASGSSAPSLAAPSVAAVDPSPAAVLPSGIGLGTTDPAVPHTISFMPLFPNAVPMTITNPLRDMVDLHAPIVPQLLPPPIVALLTAIAEKYPLTDSVLTPLMNEVLPPLLSDYILPTLMSDIVIPTLPTDGQTSTMPAQPQGTRATLIRDQLAWSIPPSGPPPAEIALGGMDMPQAPAQSPSPLPSPDMTGPAPQQLPAVTPPAEGATPLSEPVAYRAGYSEYLRNAGMAQITSVALPGIAGILLVTIGGGFIGYRQARAGHVIRAKGSARFLR